MRESTNALWQLLRSNKPIACVLYEDWASREQLIELSYLVAPSDYEVHRTETLDEVFREDRKNTLLLLVPSNEIEAVRKLDAHREEIEKRTAPLVLFLLRRGSGLQEMATRRGLAVMLRDQELDPEDLDTFEMESERQRFCDVVKQTPEEWLAEWRAGQKADSPENNLLLHQALLLERSSGESS
ncbi:MAG: hypothetical protein QM820_50165 [Minicystis sp.]